MINGLDANSELFLAALDRIQQRLSDANLQATSGKRVSVASDAPDEVSALLRLKAEERRITRSESNLAAATTDANTADNTIAASIQLLDRALTLGAQGANGTIDTDKRLNLANEIAAIQAQMQNNSTALTVPDTFQVEDPAGGSFAVAKSAAEIYDHHNPDGTVASDNVFAALDNLRIALQNNDSAGIRTAIDSVKTASGHLNTMEAFYGTVENRLANAAGYAQKRGIDLKTQISRKEDADLPAAALQITQGNTQLQAAFQTRAQLPQRSLFDYLG
jgi:flagellar hook-associated protein 3 FlgL